MPRRKQPGVHIVTNKRIYKGKLYQTHLLRRSYRENGKVKKQTLANLSSLPDYAIQALRDVLAGKTMVPAEQAGERTVRTSSRSRGNRRGSFEKPAVVRNRTDKSVNLPVITAD